MIGLWLYFGVGYTLFWLSTIWANKKCIKDSRVRQPPYSKQRMVIRSYLPLIPMLGVSAFIAVNIGLLCWIGMALCIVGIVLHSAAMYSLSKSTSELNPSGLYRFSRNPVYVGCFLFLAGLNVMGWGYCVANALLLGMTTVWIATVHQVILKEEALLRERYGRAYEEFKQKVPRYIGVPLQT